jgi:glycosyltransferase involved in cell wall biosynthesis
VRIAYLSYSSGLFDARTFRMARWAAANGFDVTIYARWEPGLPAIEDHGSYRIVRAPWTVRSLLPGGLRAAQRRMASGAASPTRPIAASPTASPGGPTASSATRPQGPVRRGPLARLVRAPFRLARRWLHLLSKYPIRPIAWARAVHAVAEPADIWHGMWAGSLPALDRLRARHGGHTIYDSRDVYMESRNLASAPRPLRWLLGWFERHWARKTGRVITVNEPYAQLLAHRFRMSPPPIVMNCPAAWTPPADPPDLLRAAAGLDADTRVVLYQGQLISDRGIEQAMDAILLVPDAALVLLGYGELTEQYRARVAAPPYAGRVHLLPAVHPDELVAWTASSDVMIMPIQPTTLNHQFTTPQKLFESIAAGVPVVASDMPGMRTVVEQLGAGVLCDPTEPAAIALGIRTVLDASPEERSARRARILRAAHERYSWEVQVEVLRGIYEALLGTRIPPSVG